MKTEKDFDDYFTKQIQESFDCCISSFSTFVSLSNLHDKEDIMKDFGSFAKLSGKKDIHQK